MIYNIVIETAADVELIDTFRTPCCSSIVSVSYI